MKLFSLKIDGFRNLEKTTLDFDPHKSLVALVGPNGQGKTNFLEALFTLAITKSFRGVSNDQMVGFGDDFLAAKGVFEKKEGRSEAEVVVTRLPPRKVLKWNGVPKKASEMLGNVSLVFFSPEDVALVHGSPSLRRQFLDLLLSQLDRPYLETALRYQAALRQRNSLLRRIADGNAENDELEFWDDELSRLGSALRQERHKTVERIALLATPFYQTVSGTEDRLGLESVFAGEGLQTEALRRSLEKSRARDLALGATQVGPHRDDLRFTVNGHDLALFGSRGEWRSLVLTLKHAEIALLEEKAGEPPILLLDDVFSELDAARQKVLFGAFSRCQTFLTTTHREFLEGVEGEKQVFVVFEGRIEAK